MKHCSVVFEPEGTQVSVHRGATILEAAGRAGVILNTVCGGQGICGKCTVTLQPSGEKVLACQYQIQANSTILVPPDARFFEQKILEHGIDKQVKTNPCVWKKYFHIDPADTAAIKTALSKSLADEAYELSNTAAEQLPKLTAEHKDTGLTAVCYQPDSQDSSCRILCFEPGDTTDSLFGIATDIGTTTVVSKLIDLSTGRCPATAADVNPQAEYGDDVIGRIAYANSDEKLRRLQQTVISCLNQQIERLIRKTDIEPKHIYEMTVAGNTTMNHIFLGLPITQLGQAPYQAFSLDAHDRPAKDMNIAINPAANIHTIENIAGFLGSDITAVALAVGIDQADEETLVIDIGTNGEIILAANGQLIAASCAAGPALEAARISQGSRAVAGAIERVIINGDDIDLDVIGRAPARTICGSGLVDAVAVLLDLGILDSTGRFIEPDQLQDALTPPFLSRIIKQDIGLAFVLAKNDDNENQPVILTQKDIREVQLAKSAIRTGTRLLQKKIGLKDSQIKHIFLAGAFGNYIQRSSALRIGLLPQVPLETIHFVGNAAESGAEMILTNRKCRALAGQLARKIKYLEIANEPDFQDVFADSMTF